MKIKGQYGEANVYASLIEDAAVKQIQELVNQEYVAGSQIAVMPDSHSGAGCVVGLTMTVEDKCCPSLVGCDIGCGMRVAPITGDCNFEQLDEYIYNNIPSGFNIHQKAITAADLTPLHCYDYLKNVDKLDKSLGTLGGGNHFIEVAQGNTGKYLIIHTGSRNLGMQVFNYYQKMAVEVSGSKITDESLAYLEGESLKQYLEDMRIVNSWAWINRHMIMLLIDKIMPVDHCNWFETIHNYVDTNRILRKGAVAARAYQQLLIPLNMADGSLLCEGLGNADWNFSAPHGAGRMMSRKAAKEALSMDDFNASMEGIYTTSVCEKTLDESQKAYKPAQTIMDDIEGKTVRIVDRLKPLYNYKAH